MEEIYLDEYLFLCGMSVIVVNRVYFFDKFKLFGMGIGIGFVDSGIFLYLDLIYFINKIELFVDLINNLYYFYDDNGYGMLMVGILCSSGLFFNNMYKGICNKSKLFCYKVFDKLGKGFVFDILYFIESLVKIFKVNNIKILCLFFEFLIYNIFIIFCFDEMFNYVIFNGLIFIVFSGSNLNYKFLIMGIVIFFNCIIVGGLNIFNLIIKVYNYLFGGFYVKLFKFDLFVVCMNIMFLNFDNNYFFEKNGIKIYFNKFDVLYKIFIGIFYLIVYICGLCFLLCERNLFVIFNDIKVLLKVVCDNVEEILDYF